MGTGQCQDFLLGGGAFKAFRMALGLVCCVLEAQAAEDDRGLERDTAGHPPGPQVNQGPGAER